VSRGDSGIVEKQLALLDSLGGDHATLYALMTRRAVDLARRRPVPPSENALAAIERSVGKILDAPRTQANAQPGAPVAP
jgi:hypothetical protein